MRNVMEKLQALTADCMLMSSSTYNHNGHYELFSDGDINHCIDLHSGSRYYLTTDCHDGYDFYYGTPDNAMLFGIFESRPNCDHYNEPHFSIQYYSNTDAAMADTNNSDYDNFRFLALAEPSGKITVLKDNVQIKESLEKVLWYKVVRYLKSNPVLDIYLEEHREKMDTSECINMLNENAVQIQEKLSSLEQYCGTLPDFRLTSEQGIYRVLDDGSKNKQYFNLYTGECKHYLMDIAHVERKYYFGGYTMLFGFRFSEDEFEQPTFFIHAFHTEKEALQHAAQLTNIAFMSLVKHDGEMETLLDSIGIGHQLNYANWQTHVVPYFVQKSNMRICIYLSNNVPNKEVPPEQEFEPDKWGFSRW